MVFARAATHPREHFTDVSITPNRRTALAIEVQSLRPQEPIRFDNALQGNTLFFWIKGRFVFSL